MAAPKNLPRVTYYVAASLDGFIAGPDGGLEWLELAEWPGEDYGYEAFLTTVDALIMGRRTWEFVAAHPPWPYADRPTRVFSGRPLSPALPGVTRVEGHPGTVVRDLSADGHEHIWLVGGGGLAATLAGEGYLTDLILTLVPCTLGGGTLLFGSEGARQSWTLVQSRSFESGVVQIHVRPGLGGSHDGAEAGPPSPPEPGRPG
ncbi:MAG: dihydrofolate reductase family protein [Gemmatimonadota bacterium]